MKYVQIAILYPIWEHLSNRVEEKEKPEMRSPRFHQEWFLNVAVKYGTFIFQGSLIIELGIGEAFEKKLNNGKDTYTITE